MRKPLLCMVIGMALLASAGMTAGLSGCAETRAVLPTPEELAVSGALPGGADAEALRRGRAIFVTECAACHRLYWPNEYSPGQWRGIVKRMAGRASLSGSQAADLDLYLSVASESSRRQKP